MASPHVRHVHSQAEMDSLLNKKSIVVVAFHAAWSAPCRMMAPFYSRLAARHRTLTFAKVEIDADNIQFLTQKCRITTLPTFIIINNEEEVDRIRGADRKGLDYMITKQVLAAEPTNKDAGSASLIAAGNKYLLEYLDMYKVSCLNGAQRHCSEPVTATHTTGLRSFWETHHQGVELMRLFQREGDLQNLSNAVTLLRESVLLCPTDHEQRGALIGNLAIALVSRYEQQGDYADLREAITLNYESLELHPPGHPLRALSLGNLSAALIRRYGCEGNISDLEVAIEHLREALDLLPPGHPDRASSLSNLSISLEDRYRRAGSLSDLKEAIEKQRKALNLRPMGHPDRASSLNNLANVLLTLFQREGGHLDLEEAIEKHREALNLRPPGHPDRASSLVNLANALFTRHQHEGSLSDVKEATERQREALSLRPPGHPLRAGSLSNFSVALLTRYTLEGSPSDVEEAIQMQREALDLCPSGHLDRATFFDRLSNALMARYQREGSLSDMTKAIEVQREALSLRPRGHPCRASSLNNLADALLTRYQREGNHLDLEEAIEKQRDALNLRPPGHPDRDSSLDSLSLYFLDRYGHTRSLSDLEEAIGKGREALNLRLPGHPDRASSLSSLSISLLTRYEREGSLLDLEEAIEKLREALDFRPQGHPDHASSLANLSVALLDRYEHTGSLSDLEEATDQRGKTLELIPHGHPGRSRCLHSLSYAVLLTINRKHATSNMHDHQALVNKLFTMLHEAVNHSSSPPLDRLQAALRWIDASLLLDPGSVLNVYSTALDQLDVVLAKSSTLAAKHSQLSSKDLVRCEQLGVEAAAQAVRQGHMTLAVEFVERGRNLLFAQIGRFRVQLEETINQKQTSELAKRFSHLSNLLGSSVVAERPTLEGRTEFEDSIGRYQRVASDWDEAVSGIRGVPGFEDFLRPPHYTALREVATEGPVVILIPDDDQSHALIILQGLDAPHHINLPRVGERELVELGNEFMQAIQSDDEDDADSRITILLRSLWVLVVGPIADALENKLRCPLNSRIWWCPSSFLSVLPLHAAGYYTSNDPNRNFPARYVSSYTPTLQALLRARSKRCASGGESMLIVAQPDAPGHDRLSNAIPEAKVVKALVETKLKLKTTLLSSNEGTHAAVLNSIANHSWIHLICHGRQNRVNPFNSCFSLYDKGLTLQNIMQRGLPDAEFAFLAACHTATGDIKLMDEALHLAAGLQFAGFKSVVGTIWEVADIDGPVIAEAFYEALHLGRIGEQGIDCRGAAHALSKAVKHLRDNGVPISRWIRHIHIGI